MNASNPKQYSNVIAIDGPSGSGKSTIAKNIAQKLDILYLDTGAMFRGIAYILDKKQIGDDHLEEFLLSLRFLYAPNPKTLIEVDGEDLTAVIREHHVSKLASIYSQKPAVRNFLKNLQRKIATKRLSILEGRDIGTVIFPDAALKIFLTASASVRAKRRFEQLSQSQSLDGLTLEQIKNDIVQRDAADSQRKIAPLKKASDAIEIDTSSMTIDEVQGHICELYEQYHHRFVK